MTGVLDVAFHPIAENAAVYDRLYRLYRRLHDMLGTEGYAENQFMLMKELLALRDEARSGPEGAKSV